jgi:acyl carrier protein
LPSIQAVPEAQDERDRTQYKFSVTRITKHTQEILGDQIMDEAQIKEKVISIVAEQMGVDKGEIKLETSFVNDLNADSLDTVELVMEFEDEFETSIPDDEAEKIQTVGQAINFIKQHIDKADE